MISMGRMRVVECNQAYLTDEAFRLRFRLNFPTSSAPLAFRKQRVVVVSGLSRALNQSGQGR